MKKNLLSKVTAFAVGLALSAPALGGDLATGGVGEIMLAAEDDRLIVSRLELLPELEYIDESRGFSFFGSLRVRADASDKIAPGQPAYRSFSSLSRPITAGNDVTLELRDFYVEFDLGGAHMRLGKQQVVWGQLDGFKLLDQVNPQSFEQFILEDFNRSRIGLWSVSAEMPLGGADLQLVYAPDRSVHDIPDAHAAYAFRAPRLRFGAPSDSASPPAGETEKAAGEGAFAARISGYSGGWDLALVGITGPDHSPVGLVTLEGAFPSLSRLYKRRTLLGASASTSFGSFVFRGEGGFFPGRSFNTRDDRGLGIVKADQMTLAAALDYDAPGGLFLSAQLIYDDVLAAPEGLTRPQNDVYLSLYAQKYFRNETIKASARLYAANGLFKDGLFRAALSYQLSDAVELGAGLDVFFGEDSGLYGQFNARDRLVFTVKRYF